MDAPLDVRVFTMVIIALLMCPSFGFAYTNHNLSWGVEVGDRIDYIYSQTDHKYDNTNANACYIIIDYLSPIPENITGDLDITLSKRNFKIFIGDGIQVPNNSPFLNQIHGYPIGNSSFVQNLVSIRFPNYDWIRNDTEWGFCRSSEYLGMNSMEKQYKQYTYSESDGFLKKYLQELYIMDEDVYELRFTTTIYRMDNESTLDDEDLPQVFNEYLLPLFIGASLGLISIIVIYLCKKRNSN